MSKPFYFRQFSIEQDKCAMKVGTDGVLLGCFVDDKLRVGKVLDIGTGTGLLSLMMAQKFPQASIDAVELDADAAAQAQGNFKKSVWCNRLNVYHTSFQNYTETCSDSYHLIVCNPPFFKQANAAKGNNQQHPDEQRAKARFSDHLPFKDLVSGVSTLLHAQGCFYVILPVAEAAELKEYALSKGLHLQNELLVTGRGGAKPNRSMMCWRKNSSGQTQISALLMYHVDTSPTKEYIQFTKDFYLWKQFDAHPDLKI